MEEKRERSWAWLWIFPIATMVGYSVLSFVADEKDRKTAKVECRYLGYREAERVGGEWFCIKIENGSDVVTPLAAVRER